MRVLRKRRRARGGPLYILDEPATGLYFGGVQKSAPIMTELASAWTKSAALPNYLIFYIYADVAR